MQQYVSNLLLNAHKIIKKNHVVLNKLYYWETEIVLPTYSQSNTWLI